jgi:hypothetical protein
MLATVAVLVLTTAAAFAFGTFRAKHTYPTPGPGQVFGVAVGDVNGDGKADIVAGNDANSITDDGLLILRGNGDGTFKTPQKRTVGDGPEGVGIGRLNGDARADLAVANYTANTVQILLGKAGGGFTSGPTLTDDTNGGWLLALADLNRDGRRDIVVANYDDTAGAGVVSVWMNPGGGGFGPAKNFDACHRAEGLAIGRMNADRRPDVVIDCEGGDISVLLGKKGGPLAAAKTKHFTDGTAGYDGVALADFNRDGRLDAATQTYGGDKVYVLFGHGDGTFQGRKVRSLPGGLGPNGLAAADFNRDGKPDLAVAGYSTFEAKVLTGKGDGTFSALSSDLAASDNGEVITAGRLNADRGPDLVLGTDSSLDVFRNKPIP